MTERSKLHDLMHTIIEHLDLSPAHREQLHQDVDDHFDPDGETTAPAAAETDTAAAAPIVSGGKAAQIEALKAQLAEQDQDDEIAALRAQLAARKTPPAAAPVPDQPPAEQGSDVTQEGA